MKLHKAKTNSTSTTSLFNEKANSSSIHFDSEPSTMLIPNSTATTFKSFIKTKGTGIIIRKDHSDDDDEEVEKLCCDSNDNSKLSNEIALSNTNQQSHNEDQCQNNQKTFEEDVLLDLNNYLVSNRSHISEQNDFENIHHNDSIESGHYKIQNHDNIISSNFTYNTLNVADVKSFHKKTQEHQRQQHLDQFPRSSSEDHLSLEREHERPANSKLAILSNSKTKRFQRLNNPILPILITNRFSGKQAKGFFQHHHHHKYHSSNNKENLKNLIKKRSSSENSSISSNLNPNISENFYSSQDLVHSLLSDRMIQTLPNEDHRRRTIIIEKQHNSFGFTLQTYGIKQGTEIELITFVDEVVYGGPAFRGGMRAGDVILSINGRDVEKADHATLVHMINACDKTMRLVVLFEDCVHKIDLHIKFIRLQKILQQKLIQLRILNKHEEQILLQASIRDRTLLKNDYGSKDRERKNSNQTIKKDACDIDEVNGNVVQEYNIIKVKCKSLDISLNDLNRNQIERKSLHEKSEDKLMKLSNENHKSELATDCNPRELSTTFPPSSNMYIKMKNEIDDYGIIDNNLIMSKTRLKSNESKSKHRVSSASSDIHKQNNLSRKCSPSFSKSIDFRSKSLPQSIADSLDCLTNEAYEDDENLSTHPVDKDHHIQNNGMKTCSKNDSIANNQNQHLRLKSKENDKNFMTKL